MSIIYQPKGKAREYSPLAANLYDGCNHGCKYCYAPIIRYKTRENYYNVFVRRNVLHELEKDCKQYSYSKNQVLLTFMSDPYNKLNNELNITRKTLELFFRYKIPVAILTKSKTVLNDINIFKQFEDHIKIGMTLTFDNEKDSIIYEPEASLPDERIEVLKTLKENNIITWASFEPVIKPEQSINMIKKSLKYVDIYKIGKINNYDGIDKRIDWNDFLQKVVDILRENKKPFYVKYDLRQAANKIKLYGNECLMDEFLVEPFKKDTLFD